MKIIILLIISSCLLFRISEASWYVVNSDNKVIVKCEYEPDTKDLESRKEFSVYTKEDIPLSEARYKQGKIIRHIKTVSEISHDNKKKIEEVEQNSIHEGLKDRTIDKLNRKDLLLDGNKGER